MKILLVCATEKEIAPFLNNHSTSKNEVDILITGPGMISTVYHLTKKFNESKYDFAINAGIAGSFLKKIPLASVVNVVEDCFSEQGAEDDEGFIPITAMMLEGEDDFPLRKKSVINTTVIKSKTLSRIQKVKGITVNTVHGNEKSIAKVINIFCPDVETMEGAAFFYVCEKEKIPFVQLRSISNYIERRDKSKWKTDVAINKLCKVLKVFVEEIE